MDVKEIQKSCKPASPAGALYIQQIQHQELGDEAMEMNDSNAYISTTRQISTEENVAYGQVESDYNLISDQCEYDYI